MHKLGYINQPEQFARAGDDCIIADSVAARQFFKLRTNADGVIFLGALYYASTQDRFMPVCFWLILKRPKFFQLPLFLRLKILTFMRGRRS